MNYNIIYILPFNLLKEKTNKTKFINNQYKLLYSILNTNAYFNNNIKFYTDFDGMSIFSILPLDFKIIHADNIDRFYKLVLDDQNDSFLLLNENHFFKRDFNFGKTCFGDDDLLFVNNSDIVKTNNLIEKLKNNGVKKYNMGESLINKDLTIKKIKKNIEYISPLIFNKFEERINIK